MWGDDVDGLRLLSREIKEFEQALLDMAAERRALVIRLRASKRLTYTEIGRIMGVTKQRAQRIGRDR